jgi:hypothetical protein
MRIVWRFGGRYLFSAFVFLIIFAELACNELLLFTLSILIGQVMFGGGHEGIIGWEWLCSYDCLHVIIRLFVVMRSHGDIIFLFLLYPHIVKLFSLLVTHQKLMLNLFRLVLILVDVIKHGVLFQIGPAI